MRTSLLDLPDDIVLNIIAVGQVETQLGLDLRLVRWDVRPPRPTD